MHIQWQGLSCFRIQTKQSVIVIDPFSDNHGIVMPKLKADIVLVSDTKSDLTNNTKRLSGDYFLIDGAGEYELKNTFIYGVPAGEKTIYIIEDEGVSLGLLGTLDSGLTASQLEKIEGVDILIVPLGSLSKDTRSELLSQIEPRVVIPSYYQQPKLKLSLDNIDGFIKEMGLKQVTPVDKYIAKPKDLPQEETTVIVLTPTV